MSKPVAKPVAKKLQFPKGLVYVKSLKLSSVKNVELFGKNDLFVQMGLLAKKENKPYMNSTGKDPLFHPDPSTVKPNAGSEAVWDFGATLHFPVADKELENILFTVDVMEKNTLVASTLIGTFSIELTTLLEWEFDKPKTLVADLRKKVGGAVTGKAEIELYISEPFNWWVLGLDKPLRFLTSAFNFTTPSLLNLGGCALPGKCGTCHLPSGEPACSCHLPRASTGCLPACSCPACCPGCKFPQFCAEELALLGYNFKFDDGHLYIKNVKVTLNDSKKTHTKVNLSFKKWKFSSSNAHVKGLYDFKETCAFSGSSDFLKSDNLIVTVYNDKTVLGENQISILGVVEAGFFGGEQKLFLDLVTVLNPGKTKAPVQQLGTIEITLLLKDDLHKPAKVEEKVVEEKKVVVVVEKKDGGCCSCSSSK